MFIWFLIVLSWFSCIWWPQLLTVPTAKMSRLPLKSHFWAVGDYGVWTQSWPCLLHSSDGVWWCHVGTGADVHPLWNQTAVPPEPFQQRPGDRRYKTQKGSYLSSLFINTHGGLCKCWMSIAMEVHINQTVPSWNCWAEKGDTPFPVPSCWTSFTHACCLCYPLFQSREQSHIHILSACAKLNVADPTGLYGSSAIIILKPHYQTFQIKNMSLHLF